ncbi:MAG: PD-(D/E)XK nuclease family protein [Bacteroidales bacterium]|nr:PD-(D/E)XK nuclease family protein [Bacteroidales bacterium]
MKTFLQECAEYLIGNYPELHRCCLVLPSNRSLRALRDELWKRAGNGMLLPEMYTIAGWMERLSGCRLPTEEEILLMLTAIHRELHPNDNESMMRFFGNAQMMLGDFNDIDLSLADAGKIFGTLLEIKKMEQEIAAGRADSQAAGMSSRYIEFCRELPIYYLMLHDRLTAKGCAYQGMMYRQVAENLDESLDRLPFDKHIFIGFSALSIAEEEIIVRMHRMNRAEMVIDCDKAYLKEPPEGNVPETAGLFIRRLSRRITPTLIAHDFLHKTEKDILVCGLPQASSQADLLPALLGSGKEGEKDGDKDKEEDATSVIVLLEEGLLLPVLFALPGRKANISMEYRLRHTPANALLHIYLAALENMERLPSSSAGRKKVYHRDIRPFFENSIMRERLMITGNAPDFSSDTHLFYNPDELDRILKGAGQGENEIALLRGLFFQEGEPDTIREKITRLLDFLQHPLMPDGFSALLQHLRKSLAPALQLLDAVPESDISTVRHLIEKMLGRISVPFQSDHNSPLQIMGMLETRALDFDRVILLSVNEGVIPDAKPARSLIPFDVRRHYRLPTYQNHEAIMTYHFYRLLQRARHISICYNMDNRQEVREKSRLIRQLQLQWEGLPNIRIRETVVPLPETPKVTLQKMEVKRNRLLQQRIESMTLSASSLNCYLECPLRFCLQHLMKLQAPSEASEEIGANVMGSVMHKILERRLAPDRTDLSTVRLEKELVETFCDNTVTGLHLHEDEIRHEKNRLVLELCQRYLTRYLTLCRKELQGDTPAYSVIRTEQRFESRLPVAGGNGIRFSGCIDRVDALPNGEHRIVDYKTGFVNPASLKIKEMESIVDGRHKEALQLMLYLLAAQETGPQNGWSGEIIPLQHPEQSLRLQIGNRTVFNADDFESFAAIISDLLAEMANPERSFEAKPDAHCTFCDYSGFCPEGANRT